MPEWHASPERRLGRLDDRHRTPTRLLQQATAVVVVVRHVRVKVLPRIIVAHLVLGPQQRRALVRMVVVCREMDRD